MLRIFPSFLQSHSKAFQQAQFRFQEYCHKLYLPYLPTLMNPLEDLGIPRGFGTPMIRFSGPKIFNDGAIQNYTAALRTPYHDRPDHKGSLLMPQEEMDALQDELEKVTLPMEDKAVETLSQAIEHAKKFNLRDGTLATLNNDMNAINLRPLAPQFEVKAPARFVPYIVGGES